MQTQNSEKNTRIASKFRITRNISELWDVNSELQEKKSELREVNFEFWQKGQNCKI